MSHLSLSPAVAAFHRSHPGREHDALRAALARYERRHGRPCPDPAAYFAAWSTADLRRRITLPAPQPPPCPDCDGEGWVYDDPADPLRVRKCLHTRRAVA